MWEEDYWLDRPRPLTSVRQIDLHALSFTRCWLRRASRVFRVIVHRPEPS